MNTPAKNLVVLAGIILTGISGVKAQIYGPEGVNMPGAWNGWTNSNDAGTMGHFRMTHRDFGGGQYVSILHIASGADTTTGTYEMLFTSGPDGGEYNNAWKDGTLGIDDVTDLTYQGSNNDQITLSADGYYTLIFRDNGYASTQTAVLYTSASPVDVSSVTQLGTDSSGTYYTTSDDQTVNITLSTTPSSEEKIYLRYSTDDWSTSAFVEASGSGTTYSATIPGQSPGVNVSYYVLTTTLTWSDGNQLDNTPDLLTLDFDNNSGANYSYTIKPNAGNNPPVITSNIGNQSVEEGSTLSFMLTATDADGDSLIWTAQNLPAGATFTDNHDGTADFEWTPDFSQSGDYSGILFVVSDSAGNVKSYLMRLGSK